jgi:hypothetical protein
MATAPLPELDFEALSAEELISWAYAEHGSRLCLTCSWQKQSSSTSSPSSASTST